MIHLQDINKTYQGAQPLHVLKGISLDIAKGENSHLEPLRDPCCRVSQQDDRFYLPKL